MNLKIGFKKLTLVLSILAFIVLAVVAPDADNIWERLGAAFFFGFVPVWLLYLFIRYVIIQVIRFRRDKIPEPEDVGDYMYAGLFDKIVPDDVPERQSINLSLDGINLRLDENTPWWVWVVIFSLIVISPTVVLALIIDIPEESAAWHLIYIFMMAVSLLVTSLLYNKANTGNFRFLRVLKVTRLLALMYTVFSLLSTPLVVLGVLYRGVYLLFHFFLMVLCSGGVFGITHVILRLAGDKSSPFDIIDSNN